MDKYRQSLKERHGSEIDPRSAASAYDNDESEPAPDIRRRIMSISIILKSGHILCTAAGERK